MGCILYIPKLSSRWYSLFENVFQKLGRKVSKHSGKVIIAWIVILVVMAPFSIVFFQNVNFNIASNIVSKNSMSYKSDKLLTTEFGGNSSSDPSNQLIIFANNTDLTNVSVSKKMLSLQETLNSSLANQSGFTGVTSIFTEMKSGMLLLSSSAQQEFTGALSIAASVPEIKALVNNSMNIEYGLPLEYLNVYLITMNETSKNVSESGYAAYSTVKSTILSGPGGSIANFQLAYLDSFTKLWNYTLSNDLNNSVSFYNMNASVADVFASDANETLIASAAYGNTTLFAIFGQMKSIGSNFSLLDYIEPALVSAFLQKQTVLTAVSDLASNALSDSLFSAFNTSAAAFVSTIYNLTSYQGIKTYIVSLISGSFESLFATNPIYRTNSLVLSAFINESVFTATEPTNYSAPLGFENSSTVVAGWMNNNSITLYPLLPTPYLKSNFVGVKFNSMLIILNFKGNFSSSVSSMVNNQTDLAASQIPGSQFLLTSSSSQSTETSGQFTHGLIIALAIGISLSILLIGVFFKSPVAAFLPLLMFLFSAAISLGINGLLYREVFHAQVSFITPTLLLILILGLTTDYMVYIMSRYRRELKSGNDKAAEVSSKWSGHAVFTSGLTVTLSYIVLWLSNIPIFSDSGFTNAIGVAVTILIANTLLIALLSRYGRKIFWPIRYSLQGDIPLEKSMKKVAEFSVHNKKKLMVALVVLTIASLYLYESTATGLDVFGLLPSNEATQIVQGVNYTFGGDVLDRNYVIIQFNSPIYTNVSGNITFNAQEMNALEAIELTVVKQPGVSFIQGPTYPFGYSVPSNLSNISSTYVPVYRSTMLGYIGHNPDYAQIEITMSSLAWDPASSVSTSHLDSNLSALENTYSFKYYMGGTSQGLNDVFSYASSTFMISLPILVIAIFIVLFVQLYAVFTPLRLIIMVLIAVVVAIAATYIIISYILHYPLIIFLPIFVVITLLAVGLDYDIFMITRVREEMMRGASTEVAIKNTIEENGGVIITLGLLLFVTFISLSFTGIPIMYEIGMGLALGVLIDTFISWPFFVPVVMLYLHKYNWWPSKISSD
jgi:RND superfamily putative drug exporter